MRFPRLTDLDSDQKEFYLRAPHDGGILAVGPPGTGKTVLAYHRAHVLAEDGQNVTVIMYGKLLTRYTEERGDLAEKVTSTTMHKWVPSWWRGAFRGPVPKKGKWKYDWEEITDRVLNTTDSSTLSKLNWGHLIIDEGQDFSREMYAGLYEIMTCGKWDENPRLTIFADDNQTIQESNSTIEDIRKSLNITKRSKRFYLLHKNYRNTREVAEFSRYFQVSKTGSAQLPDDKGTVPRVMIVDNKDHQWKIIHNVTIQRGQVEVGVIVDGKSRNVEYAYEQLILLFEKTKVAVQGYLSNPTRKNNHLNNINNLEFDKPPSVTVIHKQSCKGLEFDIVFIIGQEQMQPDDSAGIAGRKKIYVASSRARNQLDIFFTVPSGSPAPAGLSMFPPPAKGLCKYESIGREEEDLLRLMEPIDWQGSARDVMTRLAEPLAKKLFELDAGQVAELLVDAAEYTKDPVIVEKTKRLVKRIESEGITPDILEDMAILIAEIGMDVIESRVNNI